MFGIGGQEIVMIVVVLLVIFGPAKLGRMAREVGRFAYKARASMNEFEEEFSVTEYANKGHEEARRSHSEHWPEATDQTPTYNVHSNSVCSRREQQDGSLMTPPTEDTIVAESRERVPREVRE
jgi:Sec-independent protein translocase protein TatA